MSYDLHLLKCRLPEYLRTIGCELHFKNDDHFTTACPIHGGEKQNFHGDRKANGVWLWHCFSGCAGAGGTVIDAHAKLNGLSTKSAECITGVTEVVGIESATQRSTSKRETPPKSSKPNKIKWPRELLIGSEETWQAFARCRKLSFPAVHALVQAKMLRFLNIDGESCFAITDESERAGEIRRIDGGEFYSGKVYGLSGVCKEWLLGASFLEVTDEKTPIFLTEGTTDFLAAFNAYSLFYRAGGERSWLPLAVLGAGCKSIHPKIAKWLQKRTVRLAPDGDNAGDKMAVHWCGMLHQLGCSVEVLEMPRGRDLRDMLESDELKPEEIFS
ncbi:MAG: toprim domain-containing protein [Akkermansiaceae bacterium]